MEQRVGPAEQGVALGGTGRAEVDDLLAVEVWRDVLIEVGPVVDPSRRSAGRPAAAGDLDGRRRAFLRVDPPEEEQVLPGFAPQGEFRRRPRRIVAA